MLFLFNEWDFSHPEPRLVRLVCESNHITYPQVSDEPHRPGRNRGGFRQAEVATWWENVLREDPQERP